MHALKFRYLMILCFFLFDTIKCYDISKSVSFITEYVKWRKINFLIFLDTANNSGNIVRLVKENLPSLASKNIYIAIHTSIKYSEAMLNRTKQQTAIVTFFDANYSTQDFLDQANRIGYYEEKAAWLILSNCHVVTILRHANFGLDSDIVIAVNLHLNVPSNQNGTTSNIANWLTLFDNKDGFLPFRDAENQTLNCSNICTESEQGSTNINQDSFTLYQIYKIRKNANTSLMVHPLGIWDIVNSTKNMKNFLDYDNRRKFHKFPIVFGIINTEMDENVNEIDVQPIKTYFADYLSTFLNASKKFISFNTIGHNENGEWSDLLYAIKEETVDLSAEGIPKTPQRCNDFAFSFTIMKNTKNIYIEPAKSEKMRDIFLVPFGPRLFICVIVTGLILSVVITFNNFIDSRFCLKDIRTRNRNFTESVVWCIGIFAQQGSIWKTRSYTEKIIVLVSLMFTLLIYNSYSAFITSVLSVELASIRSVTDLLESDYRIGYAKNSPDEDYLRTVNTSELKQIYLRGYLQNDISNVSEGLAKVIKGNYGLFASGQTARIELWNMTKCKCKFDIDEIKIHDTVEYSGIVMSKRSGYKRLVNLSLIKMYESGVYDYIYSILYPNLIKCEKLKTFQSARLADLSSAFFLLLLGWGVSFTVMITECLWHKKNRIYRNFRKKLINQNSIVNPPANCEILSINSFVPPKNFTQRTFDFIN